MYRSVRKLSLAAACAGAFLVMFGARPAWACDLTSSSWANRDDDLDGFCNGVDLCPYDKDATNDGKSCQMQAVTVPAIPGTTAPHSIYSGATTTLKGIARYGATSYRWIFGDGGSIGWTWINNAYDLSTTHAYSGVPGTQYIAHLQVGSGGTPSNPTPTTIAPDAYYFISVDAPALNLSTTQMAPQSTDVLVKMAIDQGLWYLHQNMSRGRYGDGATGYYQPYGLFDTLASTCVALDAFQLHGSNMLVDRSTDPYREDTERLLAYVMVQAQIVGVGAKGIPSGTVYPNQYLTTDTGNGVRFGGDDTYTSGICAVAIGSSTTPGIAARTGPVDVYNQKFSDIMARTAAWFAQYQHAANDWARGGWWYGTGSNGADGSTNQWPILAMTAGRSMGVKEPDFVRGETPYFISNSEHTARDTNQGGWGYTNGNSGDYLNTAKAAAGMLEHYFVGDTPSSQEVQRGMGFMYRHWNDYGDGTDSCWNASLGHMYAMYGIMKSMRVPGISRVMEYDYANERQTGNSFDWYYTPPGQSQTGLATYLIQHQNGDGHWSDQTQGCNVGTYQATAWSTMILAPGVTNIPPTAKICNCTASWDKGAPVSFEGNCSRDSSPTYSIAKYEWDFNYDGTTFKPTYVPNYPSTGTNTVNQNGYSFYTEDHAGNPLAGVTPPVVALRVTDNTPASQGGPLVNIATCNVNIKPPPHCPNVSVGGPYYPAVNQPITFDASSSFDVDSDPITYAWDFHNTGVFTDATGAKATYTFTQPGYYVISVAGTDHPELNGYNPCTGGGCSSSGPYLPPNGDCTQVSTVTVQVGAHQPIASAGGPYTSIPNNTITLDATGSYDPDSLALTYAWDYYGAGTYKDSTAAKPSFTVGNDAVGKSYTPCVKVYNGAQYSKPACTTVTVVAKQVAPICQIVSPQVVYACTGGALKAQVDGSQSYDINGDALSYSWTTTCAGTPDATNKSLINIAMNTAQEGCSNNCTATLTVNNGYYTSSCTANIAINDTNPPVYTSTPSNVTYECDANTASKVNAWLAGPNATDSCAPAGSAVAMSNDFKPGTGCGGVGVGNTVKVTWSAQDVCSSASASIGQKSASVTVVDTTAPVLALPANIRQEATGAQTQVTFTATATDFVSGNTAVTCTPASGSTFPVGTTTVSCSSIDGAKNTANGSFTVTITDTTAPALTLPANIVGEATGAAGRKVTFTASATDLVDGVTSVTCAPASGSTFAIGTTTVNCSSTDTRSNKATGSFTVTINDTTAPAVTVPSNLTSEATGPAGAVVTFTSSASDIVDGAITPTCSPASGSTFAIGTTTVTCNATDAHANTGTNTFTVKVQDTTAPVLTLPKDITSEATGAGGAAINFVATASDIVDGNTAVTCAPASGSTFPIGTTVVNCSSTDAHGNKKTGTFQVTIQDTTAPALTLPSDIVSEATGASGTTVTFTATALDVVDGATVVSCSPASGSMFAIGQTLVTCNTQDAHHNTASGTFHVTVQDTTAPVVSVPKNIVAEATGAAGAVVTFTASAADIVSGNTAVICAPASGSTFAITSTTVTCTSTDAHANTGTNSFTVTVQDTTPPAVTVPHNIVAEATGAAGAVVTFASTALDIVDGATAVTCSPASGSTFALGTATVTCTSPDAHNNVGTNSFTVKVQDTTPPVFAGAPTTGSITEEATSAAGMTLTDYGLTASDIVDGATAVNCTPALPYTFALGDNVVNCTSTDQAGNVAPITFKVAVVDTTPPVITCPADVTVAGNGPRGAENFGVDEPTSNALKAFFAQASAVDLVDAAPSLTNDASWLFPAGQSTTVTFTSVDAHQNKSTCTAVVTVTPENVAAPALTCPSNLSVASNGAELDWTTAFRRPVSVELLVTGGAPAAGALSLAELAHHAVQLTSTPAAAGSYAVRIRATDEVSGLAVECNRFVSTTPAVAANTAGAGVQTAAALSP